MYKFFDTLNFIFALSCDKATRLMSDSMERKLSLVEWIALRGHLLSCKTGRRFRRQLKCMTKQLQEGSIINDDPTSNAKHDENIVFYLSEQARNRIRIAIRQKYQNNP